MPEPVEKRLAQFLQTCMAASWQGNDMEGGEIQDLAVGCGLLKTVPYDPEVHDDNECIEEPEPGSDWFMLADDVSAFLKL